MDDHVVPRLDVVADGDLDVGEDREVASGPTKHPPRQHFAQGETRGEGLPQRREVDALPEPQQGFDPSESSLVGRDVALGLEGRVPGVEGECRQRIALLQLFEPPGVHQPGQDATDDVVVVGARVVQAFPQLADEAGNPPLRRGIERTVDEPGHSATGLRRGHR